MLMAAFVLGLNWVMKRISPSSSFITMAENLTIETQVEGSDEHHDGIE